MSPVNSLLTLALLALFSALRVQSSPLPINGGFDKPGANWQFVADGWQRSGYWGTESQPNDVKREMDGKNPYVCVVSGAGMAKGTVIALLKEPVLLNPSWRQINVRFRARLSDFTPGEKTWHCARVQLVFTTEDGKQLNFYPSVYIDPTTEWRVFQKTLNVPEGAHAVSPQFGFWSSLGNLDLDDLELMPVE